MSDTAESIKLLQSITVAIIVLVITIPNIDNPYNQNYVLDFCIEGADDNAISFERLDFFACEIGFIDGEIDLDLYLATDIFEVLLYDAFSQYTKVDILVLNYQNYNLSLMLYRLNRHLVLEDKHQVYPPRHFV